MQNDSSSTGRGPVSEPSVAGRFAVQLHKKEGPIRYREGTNIVLLDDDVAAIFRTSEEVNSALRSLGKLIQQDAHADLAKPSVQ